MNSNVSRASAPSPSNPSPALDEFAAEDRSFREAAASTPAGGVFSFDCEAEPQPPLTSGPLLDLAPAGPPGPETPRARRRRPGPLRLAALHIAHWSMASARAFLRRATSLGGDVVQTSRVANDVSRRATSLREDTVQRLQTVRAHEHGAWMTGTWGAAAVLEQPEAHNVRLAVLLCGTAVAYCSLLMASWGHPPAPSFRQAELTPAATGAPSAVTYRPTLSPDATTVTALWRRGDTRSLDRAFDEVRHQTLAFHRCGMRVTQIDRAVARCEGIVTAENADGTRATRAATWTLDFRRMAGRWSIASVTMR